MSSHKSILIPSILLLALGASACGDDNTSPGGSTIIDTPDGGGGGGADSGTVDPDGGGGAPDGGGETDGGDSGLGGGIDREDCPEAPNSTVAGKPCWDVSACNGTASVQFLEQCSGTCIAPFNNQARIQGYTGTLPPLN